MSKSLIESTIDLKLIFQYEINEHRNKTENQTMSYQDDEQHNAALDDEITNTKESKQKTQSM
jgi:hypothetical protein